MFEKGYFWEYYLDLERQFIDFLHFVPYLDGNETVYSYRLANLLLAIGAHIDSALKEICKYPEFSKKYPKIIEKIGKNKATILDYYPIAEEYCISERKVGFKRLSKPETITPFEYYIIINNDKKTPYWWTVYNEVKHKFSHNFQKANLINVKNILAGAFLINVIHKPAIKKLVMLGVAKPIRQTMDVMYDSVVIDSGSIISNIDSILEDTIYPPFFVETDLFFFIYEKGEFINEK